MVQNVYAEGKREVSAAQSWKFQGPSSFVCGFPDDMKLSIRSSGYFGLVFFFPATLPDRTKSCNNKKNPLRDSASPSLPNVILLTLKNLCDD